MGSRHKKVDALIGPPIHVVAQNKKPLLILARAACPAGCLLTPEVLRYESGAQEGTGCGAKYSGRVTRFRGCRQRQSRCPYPLWWPVQLPPSRFLWTAQAQSATDNCLGPRRRQPMRKGSVEPPSWAPGHVDQ